MARKSFSIVKGSGGLTGWAAALARSSRGENNQASYEFQKQHGALSAGGGVVLDILDVSDNPVFDIAGTTQLNEGDTGTYTVSYASGSIAPGNTVTITVASADGTATAPDDYTALSTVLSFTGGGVTTQTVAVSTLEDAVVDGTEDYTVTISGQSAGTLGTATVETDILDEGLALDLQFAALGTLDSRITFTRASSATYRDSAGLLQTALTDVPRFDYLASGTALGLLIEGARTNPCLHNRDLTNVAWTAADGTVLKDQEGTDGVANSASSFEATAVNATVTQAITSTSAARAGSILVKRLVGTGTIELTLDGGATWTNVTAQVDSGTEYANGYYRITKTQTLADPAIGIRLATSGDKIAVDYAQIESAGFASTPIATTTVAVTRAVDNASMLTSAFPYSSTSSTLAAEVIRNGTHTGDQEIASLYQSNTQQIALRFNQTAGNAYAIVHDGGIGTFHTFSGVVLGQSHKIAYAVQANDENAAFDGTIGTQDTSHNMPTAATHLYIGRRATGSHMFGTISRLRYWPQRLPDAQLDSLTT